MFVLASGYIIFDNNENENGIIWKIWRGNRG